MPVKKGNIPWNKGKKGVMPPAWNKGKPWSDEVKKKLSVSHKGQKSYWLGKKFSEERKKQMSAISKANGSIPPSRKGIKFSEEAKLKMSINAKINNYGKWNKGRKQSKEEKEKRSISNIGKHTMSEENKKKLSKRNIGNKYALGKKVSIETRIKLSKQKMGSKNNFWRGGISPINQKIRTSFEYKEWRMMVFGRDKYTCQKCGKRGVYLHAHHIKEFSKYPELRLEISNGITLCRECHIKIHKKGKI